MEANELRIGNFVLLDSGLPMLEVHEMLGHDIFLLSKNELQLDKKIRPIEITAEWLERFGLHETWLSAEYDRAFVDSGGEVFYSWGDANLCLILKEHGEIWHSIGSQIKYIHQLQNLYFALTGTELTVKEMQKT